MSTYENVVVYHLIKTTQNSVTPGIKSQRPPFTRILLLQGFLSALSGGAM